MQRWCLFAAWLAAVLAASPVRRARAGSTLKVAATGDPSPLGGVFAGPAFSGWPSAAGRGFFVLRAKVSGGETGEALLLISPRGRVQVAWVGEESPGGGGIFKRFLGSPAVNDQGDVTFFAVVGREEERTGLFWFHAGRLAAVALSGSAAPPRLGGTYASLGRAGTEDEATATDTPDLAPAIDAAGNIAFAATVEGGKARGAIFLARGSEVEAAILLGEPVNTGGSGKSFAFAALGAPRMSASGTLAFWGELVAPSSEGGTRQGVFVMHTPGTVRPVARQGDPAGPSLAFADFAEALAIGSDGEVAFFARAASPGAIAAGQEPSLFAGRPGGTPSRLAAVGDRPAGSGSLASFHLAEASGDLLPPPAIDTSGEVLFFAATASSPPEGIFRAARGKLVLMAGPGAATSLGGEVSALESGPAPDGEGNVVFRARVRGGSTSEAVIRIGQRAAAVAVGDPAPASGTLAGPPFGDPQVNEKGEVVFRAFVAGGESSEGIFLYAGGKIRALVSVGATLPGGDPALREFLGEPSLNGRGEVAFSARFEGGATGVYVASAAGTRVVVRSGDPAPLSSGSTFHAISGRPALNNRGEVAFRATALVPSGAGQRPKLSGIFIAESDGRIRKLVTREEESPVGPPFASLGNPALSDVPSVAFRAPVVSGGRPLRGVFLSELGSGPGSLRVVAAVGMAAGSDLAFAGFNGPPALNADGEMTFLTALRPASGSGTGPHSVPALYLSAPAGAAPRPVIAGGDLTADGASFVSFGIPAIDGEGDLAFRSTVLTVNGGASGIFVAPRTAGATPLVLGGEPAPVGGHFRAFGPRVAIAGPEVVAFTASVAGGQAHNGVFLASPARLGVRLRLPLRGHRPVRLRLRLHPGTTSDGVDPRSETLRASVRGASGRQILAFEVSPGALRRHGGLYTFRAARPGAGGGLRRLRLSRSPRRRHERRTWTARALTAPIDLRTGGQSAPAPPFTVSLAIGNDSGAVRARCRGRRVLRCRGRSSR